MSDSRAKPEQRVMEELTGKPVGTKFQKGVSAAQVNEETAAKQRIMEELTGAPPGTDFKGKTAAQWNEENKGKSI